MKTKSGIRSKQGFAFATTLVIMVAVFILGIAILAMTNTEAVHTAVQYNRTQAYYAARSGVEVAIRKLQATIAAGEYDTVESLYNVMSTAGVVSGSVVPGRDTYSAQFMDDGLLAEDRMKIYSVGTQEDMSATTALTLYFDTPNYMPLDWLNPGQIIKAGFWERSTGAVVVRTAKILGHSPKKSTVADTTWRAPAIHFVDDDNGFCLEVTAKALKLQTNLLSFKHMVFFDKNNTNDTLTVETRDPTGFTRADGQPMYLDVGGTVPLPAGWGVLVLKKDIVSGNNKNSYITIHGNANPTLDPTLFTLYAFKSGTQLTNPAHWTDTTQMQLIKHPGTITYILDTINKDTTLQFDADSAIWSEN